MTEERLTGSWKEYRAATRRGKASFAEYYNRWLAQNRADQAAWLAEQEAAKLAERRRRKRDWMRAARARAKQTGSGQ
jgi:hypothetical protein